MGLRDEITALFEDGYDDFRADVLGETGPLSLLDRSGTQLANGLITSGWISDEIAEEQTGGRTVELRITDRIGIAFESAVFFGFGGIRYEREGDANPPAGNPREWIWNLRPVGDDSQRLVDDAGNFLVDDAGNYIVWGE